MAIILFKWVRLKSSTLFSLAFFVLGLIAVLSATFYSSSFVALVGLGLVFWGVILTLVRTKEYVMKPLLNDSVSYQQSIVNRLLLHKKCAGRPVFLPPRYFDDPEINKAFVPKKEGISLPKHVGTQEETIFDLAFGGMLLTPPGAELERRFEEKLDVSFVGIDLKYLQQHLPYVIVHDFEIAQDLEMRIEDKEIQVEVKNCIFNRCVGASDQESDKCLDVWFPLNTAIAFAIARTTGQPIVIEKVVSRNHGETFSVHYRIIDEAESENYHVFA